MDDSIKGFILLGVLGNVILSIGTFSLYFSPIVFIIFGLIGAITFPKFVSKSNKTEDGK
jgi:Flp pilus assembly protein TadB